MNEGIIQTLEKSGCKILNEKGSSIIAKCSNSYLVKSPSMQWRIFIPSTKLSFLKEKLIFKEGIEPQSVEIGKFVRTGNWSRIFQFDINNEIRYHFNEKSIEKTNDKKIQEIVKRLKDHEMLMNERTHDIDIQKNYRDYVKKLGDKLQENITIHLKKTFKKPVVCQSFPQTQKFLMPEGEKLMYRVFTNCIVPEIKDSVEETLLSTLERKTISQSDVRYISSLITKDDNLLLSGIKLFQKNFPHPMFVFNVKDDSVIVSKDFVDRIKTIESKFSSKSEENLKEINLDTFKKYIF